MPDQKVVSITEQVNQTDGRRMLASWLVGKFDRYKRDRELAEKQWMKNLRQYLGKYDSEDDIPKNLSTAYPKKTRVKCVSMKSRLMDLLFPASEKNWSLEASPVPDLPAETLADIVSTWMQQNPGVRATQEQMDELVGQRARASALLQEQVIDDQLSDLDPYGSKNFEALCGEVLASGILYGPGVIKGPSVIQTNVSKIVVDENGIPQVENDTTFRPYFEYVSPWDYFPDMTAKSFEQMDGEFQRHLKSRSQMQALAKRDDFLGSELEVYLRANSKGHYVKANYENELDSIGSQSQNKISEGSKYEVLEFWGTATADKLRAAGLTFAPGVEVDDEDEVRFNAWVVGSTLIKLAINPLPFGTKMFHQFIFENDEINLLGSGLPPIMRDSQMAISNFARMLLDNASTVCGPNVEVDTDLMSPGQTDMSIGPNKVWLTEGANGRQVVRSISFDSHINELLASINLFSGFADQETFVNPATGGDMDNVPGEAFRTTGAASMIYGNAALPFKDIVRNFDRFTVSVIGSLIQFNLLFHPDREMMQGDVRPIPRGSTSLMAKEMRSVALDNLSTTMDDQDKAWINRKVWLEQRFRVRDLDPGELLLSEAEYQQQQAQQQQQMQEQMDQQRAMFMAQLENMRADSLKALSQAQKNQDNGDATIFNALVTALEKGMSTDEIARITARAAAGRAAGQGQPATQRAAADSPAAA